MSKYWIEGLRFACQRCGKCCQGEPGTIYFNTEELDRLADFLHMDKQAMLTQYFYKYLDSYSARDDLEGGKCVFYKDGCTIYSVRPSQCRAFPFWKEILRSSQAWEAYASDCPGMNQGKLHLAEEISTIAALSSV